MTLQRSFFFRARTVRETTRGGADVHQEMNSGSSTVPVPSMSISFMSATMFSPSWGTPSACGSNEHTAQQQRPQQTNDSLENNTDFKVLTFLRVRVRVRQG